MVKNLSANAEEGKRLGFSPWVAKSPWRRAWQLTPIFLPEKYHGWRRLAGYGHRFAKSWTQLKGLSMHARYSDNR